jgi:hypothetical protein
MPSTTRAALATITLGLAVVFGTPARAEAAAVAGTVPVAAAAERVGVDVDGRWFALFAGAFLLIPARRAKRQAEPEPDEPRRAKRSPDDTGPAETGDAAGAPLALPAASLDDLDPEVATAVLQDWADR